MFRSILCFLALVPLAFATSKGSVISSKSTSTSTSKKCSTNYGSKSVRSLPTTSKTVTEIPETIIYNYQSTPCTTVTPTSTITSTSTTTVTTTTTALTITDTFSTTSTETDTTTNTITNTYTETDTIAPVTTTASATTTIAEPPNFEDIYTSTGRENGAAPPADRLKRSYNAARSVYRRLSKSLKAQSGLSKPQSVTCNIYVEKIITYKITSVAPTKTHTAKPVYTTTSTVTTATTTSTVVPADCSTTLSFSTTTTVESDLTVLTTATSLVTPVVTVTTTSTSYAACGTSNLLGPYVAPLSGTTPETIIHMGPYNTDDTITLTSIPDINTPYDCCVACQNDPTCAGSLFSTDLAYTAYPYPCLIWDDLTTCNNPGNQDLYAYYSTEDHGFVLSNGQCGVVVSENS